MTNKNHRLAFSLLEMSIILIIISTLSAIIVGSYNLHISSKLSSARNHTKNSPVHFIDDLVMWLETTSTASFNQGEGVDGSTITSWNDINNKSINKNNATPENSPTYIKNAMNGLPALYFNGSSNHLTVPLFINSANDFTIFAVAQFIDNDSDKNIIRHGNNGEGGTSTSKYFIAGLNSDNIATNTLNETTNGDALGFIPEIYTATVKDGTTHTISTNSGTRHSTTTSLYTAKHHIKIGSNSEGTNGYMYGYIGEILIFDRYLSDDERADIENYLSKKWHIDLN